jgi:hypothetical protein
MSINPKKPTKRGCYLALTFGTLLSSQGADALVPQPFGLRSRRYPHSTPRSASVKPRGLVRRFPRLAARSVLARCREDSTPLSGPRARGSQEGSCPLLAGPVARTGDALGAAGRPLVGGRVVERRPHRLPSHRSRPAFPGGGVEGCCRRPAAGTTPDTLAGCPAASALLVVEPGAGGRPPGP